VGVLQALMQAAQTPGKTGFDGSKWNFERSGNLLIGIVLQEIKGDRATKGILQLLERRQDCSRIQASEHNRVDDRELGLDFADLRFGEPGDTTAAIEELAMERGKEPHLGLGWVPQLMTLQSP